MDIVYISSSYLPSSKANVVHVTRMSQAFLELGHSVDLFAMTGVDCGKSMLDFHAEYGLSSGLRIHRCGLRRCLPTPAQYGWWCFRELNGRGDNLLVYARSLPGALAAVGRRLPVVYETHQPPRTRVHHVAERGLILSEQVVMITTISAALRTEYLRRYPELTADRIVVAHDGADPPPLSGTRARQEAPIELAKRPAKFTVGYAGSLYRGRGIELLASVAERIADVDFYILGGTPEEVRTLRSEHPISNLHFLGSVPHRDVHSYLAQFDVLVAPYQTRVGLSSESNATDTSRWMSPLKVFEYMAAGKPMIVSSLPVLQEVLSHGRNAVLVPPDRVDLWVKAIETLQGDPSRRMRLGKSAYEQFIDRHTWSRRAQVLLAEAVQRLSEQAD